jgi:hypothetical protein
MVNKIRENNGSDVWLVDKIVADIGGENSLQVKH